MACIYKVTNKVNNRCYVGFTHHTAAERFKRHIIDSKRTDFPFHKAIQKYGPQSFVVEVLEESENAEYLLNERESFWIAQNSNSYNIQMGGGGRQVYTPIYFHSLDGKTLTFDSPIRAACHFGINVTAIHLALVRHSKNKASGIRTADGKYYTVTRSDEDKGISHVRFNNKKKIVDQYGIEYESAFAAAKEFGVTHQRIRRAVKTGSLVGGVKLTYKEE
jgi:group I intron endonuclease